jgi:hypothetical protein
MQKQKKKAGVRPGGHRLMVATEAEKRKPRAANGAPSPLPAPCEGEVRDGR